MKKIFPKFICVIFVFLTPFFVEGAWTLKNGWLHDATELPSMPVEDHYHIGLAALDHSDWKEAALQFRIVSQNFPKTSLGQKSFFYLGVAYYHLNEFDVSNVAFSEYLKCQNSPQFFEETITYKFNIACHFKNGAKRRYFGTKKLPKWASGKSLAVEIFDEVIMAVPCHEIAAEAMFAKGELLREECNFDDSIQVYQQLIRRFPKHELAPESYVAISAVYLEKANFEQQNPDLLALSEVNLRRFQQDFPREALIQKVEKNVCLLKEVFAKALYDTAQFYERTDHFKASIIYYQNTIKEFPDTEFARLCEKRLNALKKPVVVDPAPSDEEVNAHS